MIILLKPAVSKRSSRFFMYLLSGYQRFPFMMDNSRRDFLKKAALLSGGAGLAGVLPTSIQKALAIEPLKNSSYLDAEHVVFLMQENRSFDHCFGSLQGVRGFNDPRAISLPNQNPVWLQTNKEGETYTPFRLNIKDSKTTWMGGLPHSWENQVDARNNGKHDQWLDAKRSDNKDYAQMPLTLGYYNREDIPFYYALADAFTVCDQYFCSALTGTTPNRLFFWTGAIRAVLDGEAQAHVRNAEVDYDKKVSWKTFPERLEEAGVSWKIYQNELSVPSGFKGEEDSWLSNFTDNPLEWFTQYEAATALREKAFTTNRNDPHYRELTSLQYKDGDTTHEVQVPKGDVLHQFREDVQNKQLPAVSWLVAPEKFSDHPGAPWYGAWYVSEVMDILTKDPEVWKKTIFIINYDENDGIFDHVPPFVAPQPGQRETGFTSAGLNTTAEFVTLNQELQYNTLKHARESPVGLGYRVPMIVASPWSRGGWVNSQVFDHTSCLQFLEHFLQQKGHTIQEENISSWRRTVCGDLRSVFRPYKGEKIKLPAFLSKNAVIESIHKAQFKGIPAGFRPLQPAEIAAVRQQPLASPLLPRQEKGTRPSCALPYELYADGQLQVDKKTFTLQLQAADTAFGKGAAGSPFTVYAPGMHLKADGTTYEAGRNWSYAVKAGDRITDQWPVALFENGRYHLRVYGPNGFFREYKGNAADPELEVRCSYQQERGGVHQLNGNMEVQLRNVSQQPCTVHIKHYAYTGKCVTSVLAATGQPDDHATLVLHLKDSAFWYDFGVCVEGYPLFEKRYAGRVETGRSGTSDPLMGGL
jgi:phospholipase C